MPSAKMTVWNEAMYYFHVAPAIYRKIFFVLKHSRREQSLASYYLKTHGHSFLKASNYGSSTLKRKAVNGCADPPLLWV